MLITFFLGFSSGLPLLTTGSTLQAWMKDAQVDLSTIGLFSLVGLPYTLKFLWAPIFDRYVPLALGRRRGWMLITQLAVAGALVLLGLCNPARSLYMVALAALLVSFVSASQDIVLDAQRRDSLQDHELGFGSALFINGYRIGMLAAGAFALYLADRISWDKVYFVLAGMMLIGIFTTFLSTEPKVESAPPKTLKEAVIAPFMDYFSRTGAIEILVFILLYKLGDSMASAMITPFVLDLGFSKTELAGVAKTFGLFSTIAGGLLGGALIMKIGINRSLWLFGLFQAVTIVGFSLLVPLGKNISALAAVIGFENFSAGMGTSAYAAFMASVCNRKFSATQFALLSSLMGIPRVLISSPTGYLAEAVGWSGFFIVCALAAIPGMILLIRIAPWHSEPVSVT